jgi:RsiW-degrading membrane proteinase PrsW (M82 family)
MLGPSIGSFMWNLTVTSNPTSANMVIPFGVAAFFWAIQIIPVLMIKETKNNSEN